MSRSILKTRNEEEHPTLNVQLPTSKGQQVSVPCLWRGKFRVQSSEFSVQCSEFSVQCSVFSVQSSVFRVQCSEFSVQCSEFSVQSSEFSVFRFFSNDTKAFFLIRRHSSGLPDESYT